jgi:large subunit ribosomal protein L24
MKLRKGDDIVVLSGKYRGERAKVESARPKTDEVILDSLNIAKRHTRQTSQLQQAGIIDKFMPLKASTVALWCDGHKGPARVGVEDRKGVKVRVCKKCGKTL